MQNIKQNLIVALSLVGAIWIIHIVNMSMQMQLNHFGIFPRHLLGLRGVAFAPFLHGDLMHIMANTLPLFFLTLTMLFFFPRLFAPVFFLSMILGGLLVWFLGRSAMHIGASGVIYSLAGFLMAIGIFRRNFKSILISVVIFFLYGGILWGIFPMDSFVSWEGHLYGFVSGVFLAYLFRKMP